MHRMCLAEDMATTGYDHAALRREFDAPLLAPGIAGSPTATALDAAAAPGHVSEALPRERYANGEFGFEMASDERVGGLPAWGSRAGVVAG